MRRALLLLLALSVLPVEQVRSDDDKPPDPRIPVVDPDPSPEERDPNSPLNRAFTVIGGLDEKYAALREMLAQSKPAEALAVLDALRDVLKSMGRPLAGLPEAQWLSAEPLADAQSKSEVPLMERGLAEPSPWTWRTQAHFLRIRTAKAASLLGSHAPDAKGGVRVVPLEVVKALLGDIGSDSGVLRDAPSAAALSGQTVTLVNTSRVRYLMDYSLEGSNSWTKELLVGAMECGSRALVTGSRTSQPGDRIALEVVLQVGAPVLPMKILTGTLMPKIAESVTIQLPEVRLTGISEKLDVVPDTWVLACCPRASFETDFAAALIHVQRGPALSRTEDFRKQR